VNSGKQLIPCETKISAYTGETPMPPWPLRLTPFPHTLGFLRLVCFLAPLPIGTKGADRSTQAVPPARRDKLCPSTQIQKQPAFGIIVQLQPSKWKLFFADFS